MSERKDEKPSATQASQASAKTREKADPPQRNRTDESLRAERSKADSHFEQKRDAMEEEADEVVRIARKRARKVVRSAREDADLKHADDTSSGDAEESMQRLRAREDVAREREYSIADAVLQREREEQRRYLEDFLAAERDATDADLVGERAFTDDVVEARDQVLATVSHDLRTLLAGLAVSAGLLMENAPEGEGGEKIRSYAGMTRRVIVRMNRLVSDLLDVASIEAGGLSVAPDRVEVDAILRDTLESLEPIAAAKQITLEAEPLRNPLQARLDEGRVLQVLANLISNAIRFTPEGGTISIRVDPEGDELHFAVSDTGVGIPADELTGIFDRFRQVARDRRGLGLGLHISKAIVEAHGGRMWAESEIGVGSTFHFVLPAS